MWIAIVSIVVGVVAVGFFSRYRRRGRLADLGSVSEQWMSEHRSRQLGDRVR